MASDIEGGAGPDFAQGVTLADFAGGEMLLGHVGEDAVLLARVDGEILAVSAVCTHYGGPLEQGIIVDGTVRCPLHHARFSLHTGEALGAPAFDSLARWKVVRDGERIIVQEQLDAAPRSTQSDAEQPRDIVIIGGGAAGFACAEMLRRHGFRGQLTMLSADTDAPYDRPNLSKDFLAGEAPDEWMPLKPEEFYTKNRIDLQLAAEVVKIRTLAHEVETADGRSFHFDRLLIATGAEPIALPIPGADQPHVMTLRSFADSRALAERATSAKTAVILGSGFIGLEVAAALRARGLEVQIVSLDAQPLEKVLGGELGGFVRDLHESHGVTFHMKASIASIGENVVTLDNGKQLSADIVVIGIGVKPRTALAKPAGIAVEKGILVNDRLETSAPDVYAAGDVARWQDADSGETSRVEHWVVAERQGQLVARNMLGAQESFRDVPFFWSAHYDVEIRYVGHAEGWDALEIDGDIAGRDCVVRYKKGGKLLAVAAIGRDRQALECEVALAQPA